MKITKVQYERAKKHLPKFAKARRTVDAWDEAIAEAPDGMDVIEIEFDDNGKPSFKGQRKEPPHAKDAAA